MEHDWIKATLIPTLSGSQIQGYENLMRHFHTYSWQGGMIPKFKW